MFLLGRLNAVVLKQNETPSDSHTLTMYSPVVQQHVRFFFFFVTVSAGHSEVTGKTGVKFSAREQESLL